jgi:hypothetical protein
VLSYPGILSLGTSQEHLARAVPHRKISVCSGTRTIYLYAQSVYAELRIAMKIVGFVVFLLVAAGLIIRGTPGILGPFRVQLQLRPQLDT